MQGIEAIREAEHLPTLFRDIFRNAFLKFRDGRILTLFLNEVNGFAYSHGEELGNAFEYLLKCMGIQGENGQFRTPRHIEISWSRVSIYSLTTASLIPPAARADFSSPLTNIFSPDTHRYGVPPLRTLRMFRQDAETGGRDAHPARLS